MPRAAPLQGDFSSGEISPLFYGRVDSARYNSSLKTCLNYIPTLQGGLIRRPGTQFIAESGDPDHSNVVQLIPFEFSSNTGYVLEFLESGLVYFYTDKAQIQNGGSPYTIATSIGPTQTDAISYAQFGDIIYLVHPDYRPQKLTRLDDDVWQLDFIEFIDGPYQKINNRGHTLTSSGTTGSVSVTVGEIANITNVVDNGAGLIRITVDTANVIFDGDLIDIDNVVGVANANSAYEVRATGIANTFDLYVPAGGGPSIFSGTYSSGGDVFPYYFESASVGQHIRMFNGTGWGWGEITGLTNAHVGTVSVREGTFQTSSTTLWKLGAIKRSAGALGLSLPTNITFHENRMVLTGMAFAPQLVAMSKPGEFEDFGPTALSDGSVSAGNGLEFFLASGKVDNIEWALSDEKGLLIGTGNGEKVMRSASTNEALSATSVEVKPSTSYGCSKVKAVKSSKAALFIQAADKKVLELNYFFDVDGFRATDLTYTAQHITDTGITEIAFQLVPQPILWCIREDGKLAAMTYERDIESLRVGWSLHSIAGDSDAGGTAAKVDSIAVIPSTDGKSRELWMSVRRYIDGSEVRHIEVLTDYFEEDDKNYDAWFVDSGLEYDSPLTVSSITKAEPPVVTTSTSHGISNGDKVRFYNLLGMTQLNDNVYTVANVTATTFELTDSNGDDIDSSGFGTYVASSGEVRELITSVSGLSHLEGQTVQVFTDGYAQTDKTVSSGGVTLDYPAAIVRIGLGYNSDAEMLRLESGSATGTALGKTRRIHRVGFLLHRSLNLKFGPSFDKLTTIQFTSGGDPMTQPPPLFSGIKSKEFTADYNFENYIAWRQDKPLPSTVLAVLPQMATEDRG